LTASPSLRSPKIETDPIVDDDDRTSAITSKSIGVPELVTVLGAVETLTDEREFERVIVDDNVLALDRSGARENRLGTLRRLYRMSPLALTFRALADLWRLDVEAQPLLAGMCAMAHDTVFRATAAAITSTMAGDELAAEDFMTAIESRWPDAYQDVTLRTISSKASTSWEQTGHLGSATQGVRVRQRATATPATTAYALLMGHVQGHRGAALFETVWAQVQDRPTTHLQDLAFQASQQGMLEFRHAGGVIEVGFQQLLRPMEEMA
jgi:hypothetical protein